MCSPAGHLIGSCHVSRSAAELRISYQLFCKEKLWPYGRDLAGFLCSIVKDMLYCEGHAVSIQERFMTEHTVRETGEAQFILVL